MFGVFLFVSMSVYGRSSKNVSGEPHKERGLSTQVGRPESENLKTERTEKSQ